MSCIKEYCDGWDDGYAYGLDAAREAVRERFWPSDGSWVTDQTTFDSMGNGCLAAIDALRENRRGYKESS